MTHAIKVRVKGSKSWAFLAGSDGKTNRLRIHAVRLTEDKARRIAEEIAKNNPAFDSKVVAL